jgi:hypothetical protein
MLAYVLITLAMVAVNIRRDFREEGQNIAAPCRAPLAKNYFGNRFFSRWGVTCFNISFQKGFKFAFQDPPLTAGFHPF